MARQRYASVALTVDDLSEGMTCFAKASERPAAMALVLLPTIKVKWRAHKTAHTLTHAHRL